MAAFRRPLQEPSEEPAFKRRLLVGWAITCWIGVLATWNVYLWVIVPSDHIVFWNLLLCVFLLVQATGVGMARTR